MNAQDIYLLAQPTFVNLAEFTTISFIILAVYVVTHKYLNKIKHPTRVLLSMLLGFLSYTTAKLLVLTFVTNPILLR